MHWLLFGFGSRRGGYVSHYESRLGHTAFAMGCSPQPIYRLMPCARHCFLTLSPHEIDSRRFGQRYSGISPSAPSAPFRCGPNLQNQRDRGRVVDDHDRGKASSGNESPVNLESLFSHLVRRLNSEDGLPQNTVEAICQPRDGYLCSWLVKALIVVMQEGEIIIRSAILGVGAESGRAGERC